VSRHHIRKDKTCLNCGAIVQESFCSRCGQENTEPKENFGHLVGHFFEDITHFDAKIFTTLKDLVLRPGFLTREYIAGKRVRYLNPVRMYVFISAVFFLAAFAGSKEEHGAGEENNLHATNLFRQQFADSLRNSVKPLQKTGDSLPAADSIRSLVNEAIAARLDTIEAFAPNTESFAFNFTSEGKVIFDMVENKYLNLREFDSAQRVAPDSDRATGMLGWLLRNNVRLKEKHAGRSHIRLEVDLQHTIPKIMFVVLPLFALFVGWFYNRKKYLYVQHAIFSVHFHSFVFLLFLVFLLMGKVLPGEWAGLILAGLSPLLIFAYLVAALKNMYGQSFGLSLVKAFVISLLYILSVWAVLLLLALLSFLTA
jgi:hypothetical protein